MNKTVNDTHNQNVIPVPVCVIALLAALFALFLMIWHNPDEYFKSIGFRRQVVKAYFQVPITSKPLPVLIEEFKQEGTNKVELTESVEPVLAGENTVIDEIIEKRKLVLVSYYKYKELLELGTCRPSTMKELLSCAISQNIPVGYSIVAMGSYKKSGDLKLYPEIFNSYPRRHLLNFVSEPNKWPHNTLFALTSYGN